MLPLALVVAVATAGLSEPAPTRLRLIDRPGESGALGPGTGQLIAATATGIVGLVGGGISVGLRGAMPNSYAHSSDAVPQQRDDRHPPGWDLAAELGDPRHRGLVKWFTAPAPLMDVRLAGFAPKRPPNEPWVVVNVARF